MAGAVTAGLVLLATLAGPPTLLFLFGDRVFVTMRAAGVASYASLLCLFGAAFVLAVLGFFMASRGTKIPVSVPLFIGLGPWVVGALGTWWGVTRADAAIAYAEPSMRLAIGSAGLGEAVAAVGIGAACAGPPLLALGFGLALGARAREGFERATWPAALAGALAAASMLAIVIRVVMVQEWSEALLVLVALWATGTLVIAGASIGKDGRSGAGAVGAAACALAGLTLTVLSVRWLGVSHWLGDSAMGDPASRSMFVSRAILADDLSSTAGWCAAAIGLGTLALAAVAVRQRQSVAAIALGCVAALAALTPALGDVALSAALTSTAERWSAPAFDDAPDGFTPAFDGEGDTESGSIAAWASPDGLRVAADAAPIAWTNSAALAVSFAQITSAPRADSRDRFRELMLDDDPTLARATWDSAPSVRVALDSRIDSAALVALFTAAATAPGEARAIQLVFASASYDESQAEFLARSPMIGALSVPQAVGHRVLPMHPSFDAGLQEGYCTRELGGGEERCVGGDPEAPRIVTLGNSSLLTLLSAIQLHDPIFIQTREPPAQREPEPSPDRQAGGVSVGAMTDESGSGIMDSNAVTAAIRRRTRAIQRCYERELRTNPMISGRVEVEFTVMESGAVTGARAVENTTGSAEVGSCVVNVIRRLRFNPGADGGSVRFRYPFVFAPG